MVIHVITERSPIDTNNDGFFHKLTDNFHGPKVLTTLEGRTVFEFEDTYRILLKDHKGYLRIIPVQRVIGSGVGVYRSESNNLGSSPNLGSCGSI